MALAALAVKRQPAYTELLPAILSGLPVSATIKIAVMYKPYTSLVELEIQVWRFWVSSPQQNVGFLIDGCIQNDMLNRSLLYCSI